MASIERVTVVGAGTMGHGIAQVAAAAGVEVRLHDVSVEAIERGISSVRHNLDRGVDKGKVTEKQRDATLAKLHAASDLDAAAAVSDLVIEAVPESIELKREIFGRADRSAPAHTILATNTSSLSVAAIAASTKRPAKVVGMHFFNPVHLLPLLEVVRAEATAETTVEVAVELGQRMGKEPIVVRDSPGFASSRLGLVIGLEAMRMVEQEVASPEDIDKAMTLGYRHPMGPLRLTDLVGLDVRLAIAEYLHEQLGSEAFRPPEILRRLVSEGKLGKKSGRGFYEWGIRLMEQLIPEALFLGWSQPALLAVIVVGVGLLSKGADWLVEGASGLAYRFGMSKVIVGATIVSLGTTSPECAVSVMAAWSGQPGLALGNALGSIIADSGLIFGLGCLLAVLPADRFVLSRQGWVQFGSGMLLAAICYGLWVVAGDAAVLGRWVGLLMLVLLVLYMWVSVRWSRQHRHGEPFQADDEREMQRKAAEPLWQLCGLGALGLAFVLLSSRVMILSVSELAEVHWHVPEVVIAATLVALGTSLPELVIGITSIYRGHPEILVGNVIGADILNVLFVVGASASAAPLPIIDPEAKIPEIALYIHIPTMLLVLVMFRVFIFSAVKRGSFRRWYGIPLVALYVAYTAIQFIVS